MKIVAGWIAAAVGAAALILGGWQAGWWFKTQNTNREASLYRNSYGFQQSLRDQLTSNISTVVGITAQIAEPGAPAPELAAQRLAVLRMVCSQADQITGDPLPVDQQEFVSRNCYAGVVSPDSPYEVK